MRKTIPLLLITAFVLAGCGSVRESRFNPFNWFGRAESRAIDPSATNPLIPRRSAFARPEPEDTRTPIANITALNIERLPNGAIVRATGVSARQGAYSVALRQIEGEEVPADTLRYELVASQPMQAVGTEPTRTVNAAVRLTDQDLLAIRRIEVLGSRNALTARR